jgi:hypothetical protein
MEKVRQKDYQNKGNDYQIKEMIVVPCYFSAFSYAKGKQPTRVESCRLRS